MKTCTHPGGCLRSVIARGLCNAHYLRMEQHGQLGPAAIRQTRNLALICAVEGCERRRAKRGWCGTHYERWRKHGDVSVSLVGRGNPSYLAAHKQIHRRKGRASSQTCAHCGAQAKQWAYDHLDKDERLGTMHIRDQDFELRYSVNPDHYIALCVPCHLQFDRAVPV